MRDKIFVSYSRADRAFLGELRTRLSALPNADSLAVWEDTGIAPSEQWRQEIEEALTTAAAAVLLLSPSFFASEFIQSRELPVLLAAAGRGELRIFPVVVEPCDHGVVTEVFQAVHDPSRPLEVLGEDERAGVWSRLLNSLVAVADEIGEEERIGAEIVRLTGDLEDQPDIVKIDEKIARAKAEPALDDIGREQALVFLEVERCLALSNLLIEEMGKPGVTSIRSQAIVRKMQKVQEAFNPAQNRATEMMRQESAELLAALKEAKENLNR